MLHQRLLPKKHLRLLTQLRSNQEDGVEYDDCGCIEIEHDLHRGYTFVRFNADDEDDDLSDYVKIRLAMARLKALAALKQARNLSKEAA